MLVADLIRIISARLPGKYIRGQHLLFQLRINCQQFGNNVRCIVDGFLFDAYRFKMETLAINLFKIKVIEHGGECSDEEIDRSVDAERNIGADVVVGFGGGKALDTAKITAEILGVASIIVPSIAASDAPCSALGVVYNDDGTVKRDHFLRRNSDLVLVDTVIIWILKNFIRLFGSNRI